MLTIHDLLEDATYKSFLQKVPELPAHYTEENLPWRLMVQYKPHGRWLTKRFGTYREMFEVFRKIRHKVHDAALNCPPMAFPPPDRVVRIKGKFHTNAAGERRQVTKLTKWKPRIPEGEFEDHIWCGYCRRPTVFKRFTKHHALPHSKTAGVPIDPSLLRCSICGASEMIVNLRGK